MNVDSPECVFKAARNRASVVKSSAEKLSSKMNILGFLIIARAIASL